MLSHSASQPRLLELVPCSAPLKKLCPKCGKLKALSDFASRRANRGQPCSYCRHCQREYCREHYRNHCKLHNSRRYERQKSERAQITERIREYKRTQACADCGETETTVL